MDENIQVVSVDRMRQSDAYTIEHLVPGRELMRRAAAGVYDSYGQWCGKRIAILAGGGNNGGDGYALAGILMDKGIPSVVFMVSDKMSDEGRYYSEIAAGLGVEIREFLPDTDLSGYDVIVDCILGTGFSGEVRGKARDAIEAVNSAASYVISVDIPSGMNGDTGEAYLAVKADMTVSIGFIKQGLVKEASKDHVGTLVNVDIGIVLV